MRVWNGLHRLWTTDRPISGANVARFTHRARDGLCKSGLRELQNWTCVDCTNPERLPATERCGKVSFNVAERLKDAGAPVTPQQTTDPRGLDVL